MKVILKQDVKDLGKKENMVEVSDGYGRNYLLPRGLAVEASSANLNVMKTKKDSENFKKDREIAQAKALADKIKGIELVLKVKAGENGKLFGSITSKDISDKLKKDFKMDIDKKKINLVDALKRIGTSEIEIKLYHDVIAKLVVKIEAE
jgi:large subunit ribosomal protein L9